MTATLQPEPARTSRRALLAAAAGAAAALATRAVVDPDMVRAAGDDGATLTFGGLWADIRSQTTLANQANNNIVLYVASNAGGGAGGGVPIVGFSAGGVGLLGATGSLPSVTAPVGVAGTSPGGKGVYGSGSTGVDGNGNVGVHGTGTTYGVRGDSEGWAVFGSSSAGYAVHGETGTGTAIDGFSSNGTGVSGHSLSSWGVIGTSTSYIGVEGSSESSFGVSAASDTNTALRAQSTSGIGVSASSGSGVAVLAASSSTGKAAVRGHSYGDSTGILGYSGLLAAPTAKAKTGVYGYANQDRHSKGIHGESVKGYAGYFAGKVYTSKFHEMKEIGAPPAPGANRARLFVRDNGSGKSQLCVRFHSGAILALATQP